MNRKTRKAFQRSRAMLAPTRAPEPKDDPTGAADRYFVHPEGGRFHACYFIPGTRTPSSVADCLLERSARREVNRLNSEINKDAYSVPGPDDRRIAPGFYTEQMELV